MSANNLLKKKSVIYDKDSGTQVYKKKLRKIFTSNDPEMNPSGFDSIMMENGSFSAQTSCTTTHPPSTSSGNQQQPPHEQHQGITGNHHDITVKPFYNMGDKVNFRERSQTVDQIGFVYHKKASSLHEKERIPKCVVYMLNDEKYWVLEWLLMKENEIEVGEREFESSEKSSPPPLNAPVLNNNNSSSTTSFLHVDHGSTSTTTPMMTLSKSSSNVSLSNHHNNQTSTTNSTMGNSCSTNNLEIGSNHNHSTNSMTSRFGNHHSQNSNNNNNRTSAFSNHSTSNGHYHGITKSNKTISSSIQLSQHLSSILSSIDSKSIPSSHSVGPLKPDDQNVNDTLSDSFFSSNQKQADTSTPSKATLSSEMKELLLNHPFLSQKNNNNHHHTNYSQNQHNNNNISRASTIGTNNNNIHNGTLSSSNNNNNTMDKLAQQSQFNSLLFNAQDGSTMNGGLHHHPMNSMRRIPSNGNSVTMTNNNNNNNSMNQLFATTNGSTTTNSDGVNDANSQLKKQIVLNHIQQRQQLVNQQLMELLNQQNRRQTLLPSSKYDLNLLNMSNNYQYNITPSCGAYSQSAIISFNHNFELRPTDMLQFLVIQVKDGQNLKAFCVNPVISYDNDALVSLNELSNRIALGSNIPNLDEELSKFVHSSPLLVTLPPQEEPSNVLIVLMKNFIPITSPLLFEYTS